MLVAPARTRISSRARRLDELPLGRRPAPRCCSRARRTRAAHRRCRSGRARRAWPPRGRARSCGDAIAREQRDVLGLHAGAREGQRAAAPRLHFGEEVVRAAAAGTTCRGSGPARSRLNDFGASRAKTSCARRSRRGSTGDGGQPSAVDTRPGSRPGSCGRTRVSNGATSVSAPEKMRSWPRSVSGVGEKRISPRPSSTRPVTPPSPSTGKTAPSASVSRKSSELMSRSRAANWRRRVHAQPEQPFDRRQAFAADDAPRVAAPPAGRRTSRRR